MEVRRLLLDEMDAAARVHRMTFDQRLPWLSGLHTPAEDRAFFREHVFSHCEVWGAFQGELLGFIAFRSGWLDQLYVLPAHQGSGIGSTLLGIATQRHPRLQLWTFQRNEGARAFYERHGFVAVRFTDGSENDEKEPDVLYAWRR
ncbi:GNAT family N-acetyltransferase [Pyxidicoccus fallax]|nr:GNAT family N-acetyltransferase [Pyxidicoccus fallax]